jgi:flagellar hook-length control protein FliK
MPKAVSSIRVEVHPPDLGEVQLRVTLADQTVRANVTTQHAEVREFLVVNQSRLEAGFQAAGLDLSEFKVMVDQHGRGQYGQNGDGWSYGSGRNTDGQGRMSQEQASQPDYRPELGWNQAVALEGGGLSLFA